MPISPQAVTMQAILLNIILASSPISFEKIKTASNTTKEKMAFALNKDGFFNSLFNKKHKAIAMLTLIIPKKREVPIMPNFGTKTNGNKIEAKSAPI